MQRKKILWLVSWYPNKNDRFDGDFIQRHARAAAIYHDVHVIFVTDTEMHIEKEEEWNYATGLTEQIIYFKKKKGIAARIRKQIAWKSLFQEAVKKYIDKNSLPDCVHVHIPWKAGLIALWMKKKYGKGFIITEHWGIYNNIVEGNFYTQPRLIRSLLKKLFTQAKTSVSVSNFLASGIERISEKKTDLVIPNVVDTTLFFYKDEKYSKFSFIHVSNMVALKNVKGILDAFKKLHQTSHGNFQLILVGNRDDEYPKYAQKLGLLNRSVFFRGEIPYQEVAKEMQRSHCLILNSNMENSPCVIGEALCCGMPVIATNVGGIPELVYQSNSRLIEPNDDESLLAAMTDLLNKYATFDQEQISQQAAKKFSYSTIAQKFDDLYRNFYQ